MNIQTRTQTTATQVRLKQPNKNQTKQVSDTFQPRFQGEIPPKKPSPLAPAIQQGDLEAVEQQLQDGSFTSDKLDQALAESVRYAQLDIMDLSSG